MNLKTFGFEVNTVNGHDIKALKRLASPAEITRTALFLASEDYSYVTGQIIRVDGGL